MVNIVGGCVSSYAANYFMGGQQRSQSSTNQNSCWDDNQWDTKWSTPGNSAGESFKDVVKQKINGIFIQAEVRIPTQPMIVLIQIAIHNRVMHNRGVQHDQQLLIHYLK